MLHEGFNSSAAEKAAIGQRQPLLACRRGNWLNEKPSLIDLENTALVITAFKMVFKVTQ